MNPGKTAIRYYVTVDGEEQTVDLTETPDGKLLVALNEEPVDADLTVLHGSALHSLHSTTKAALSGPIWTTGYFSLPFGRVGRAAAGEGLLGSAMHASANRSDPLRPDGPTLPEDPAGEFESQ